jgi:hypothetical protein
VIPIKIHFHVHWYTESYIAFLIIARFKARLSPAFLLHPGQSGKPSRSSPRYPPFATGPAGASKSPSYQTGPASPARGSRCAAHTVRVFSHQMLDSPDVWPVGLPFFPTSSLQGVKLHSLLCLLAKPAYISYNNVRQRVGYVSD